MEMEINHDKWEFSFIEGDQSSSILKKKLCSFSVSSLDPSGGAKPRPLARDVKRRPGSTLSKPQHLCRGVEGLTSDRLENELQKIIRAKSMTQRCRANFKSGVFNQP